MNQVSRTFRSVRNLGVSLATQLMILALSFVTRTIFVRELGAELLGVNALFVNILTLLALADLGLASAITYSMYAPLASGDVNKVAALVEYCRRVYRYVALVIGVAGLVVLPFVGDMVRTDGPVAHLRLYFIILLLDTVVGYLLAHRPILLMADQRLYLVKLYTFWFQGIRYVSQVAVLLAFHSYLLYLTVQVVATFMGNLFAYWRTGRLYAFLHAPTNVLLPDERRTVRQNIGSLFMYRIGGAILNQSDIILISVLAGTLAVGLYSNYVLVIGSTLGITELVFAAMAASVGNLNTTASPQVRRRVFDEIHLVAFWVHGSISIYFLLYLNPLVDLWLGGQYVLSDWVVLAAALNFYLYGIMYPVGTYRMSTGMFRETRYIFLVTVVLNLLLSVALGRVFGIAGVLFATALARLLTQLWFEPKVLFNRYFKIAVRPYLTRQALLLTLLCGTYLVCRLGLAKFGGENLATRLAAMVAVAAVPHFVFWFVLRRGAAYQGVKGRVRGLLDR